MSYPPQPGQGLETAAKARCFHDVPSTLRKFVSNFEEAPISKWKEHMEKTMKN